MGAILLKVKLLSAVTAALILVSTTLSIVTKVFAADPPPAQGIQISPVLIDLNAEKSNSYNLKITVTNVTAGELVLKQNINDFRAKDESGNPEIILDENDVDPTFSLKSWMTPAPNMTLKSKESRVVDVQVDVPADAEAGGHYGVVRFSGFAPGTENDENVAIAASVGVLVLARVNGAITESLRVKDFFVEKEGKKTGLLQASPLTLVQRLENDGNVHVKPKGTITVKNMFGSTITAAEINETGRNILPNSTRRLAQEVNKKWMFGRYTAQLDATYGYGNKVLTSTVSFWVIPYRLILIVLLVLIVLFFGIKKGLKRYNDKVIQQALKKQR